MKFETSKTYYVIEKVDSIGFYLILEKSDDKPNFTRVADDISKYSSKGLAELIIERINSNGFVMELEIKQMEVTHRIF